MSSAYYGRMQNYMEGNEQCSPITPAELRAELDRKLNYEEEAVFALRNGLVAGEIFPLETVGLIIRRSPNQVEEIELGIRSKLDPKVLQRFFDRGIKSD